MPTITPFLRFDGNGRLRARRPAFTALNGGQDVQFSPALAIAARIPGAQRGCVEVRPIADDAPTRALGLGN